MLDFFFQKLAYHKEIPKRFIKVFSCEVCRIFKNMIIYKKALGSCLWQKVDAPLGSKPALYEGKYIPFLIQSKRITTKTKLRQKSVFKRILRGGIDINTLQLHSAKPERV